MRFRPKCVDYTALAADRVAEEHGRSFSAALVVVSSCSHDPKERRRGRGHPRGRRRRRRQRHDVHVGGGVDDNDDTAEARHGEAEAEDGDEDEDLNFSYDRMFGTGTGTTTAISGVVAEDDGGPAATAALRKDENRHHADAEEDDRDEDGEGEGVVDYAECYDDGDNGEYDDLPSDEDEVEQYEDEDDGSRALRLLASNPVIHPHDVSTRPIDVRSPTETFVRRCSQRSVSIGPGSDLELEDRMAKIFDDGNGDFVVDRDNMGRRGRGRLFIRNDPEGLEGGGLGEVVPGGMFGATMDLLLSSSRFASNLMDDDRVTMVAESIDEWRGVVSSSLTPPSLRIGHLPTLPPAPRKTESGHNGTATVTGSTEGKGGGGMGGSIWDVPTDFFSISHDDDDMDDEGMRDEEDDGESDDLTLRPMGEGRDDEGGDGDGGDEPNATGSDSRRRVKQRKAGSFFALALEFVGTRPSTTGGLDPSATRETSGGVEEDRCETGRGDGVGKPSWHHHPMDWGSKLQGSMDEVGRNRRRRRRRRQRPFTIPDHLLCSVLDQDEDIEDDDWEDDDLYNDEGVDVDGVVDESSSSVTSSATLDWLRRRKDEWRVLRVLVRSNRIVEERQRFVPPVEASSEGTESPRPLSADQPAPTPVLLDPDLPSRRSEDDDTSGPKKCGSNVVHCVRGDILMAPGHLERVLSCPSSCPPDYTHDRAKRAEAMHSAMRDFAHRVGERCRGMDHVPTSISSASVGYDDRPRPTPDAISAMGNADGLGVDVYGCQHDVSTDDYSSSLAPSVIRHDDEPPPPSGKREQPAPASGSGHDVSLPSAVYLVRGTTAGLFGRGSGGGLLLQRGSSRGLHATDGTMLQRRGTMRTVSQIMRLGGSSSSPVGLFIPHHRRTGTDGDDDARGFPPSEREAKGDESPEASLPSSIISAVRNFSKRRGCPDEGRNLRIERVGYPLHGWDDGTAPQPGGKSSSPLQSEGRTDATDAVGAFRARAVERQRRDSTRELLHTGCRMRRTVEGKCIYRGMLSDRVVDSEIYRQRYYSMIRRSRGRRQRVGSSAVDFDRTSIPSYVLPSSLSLPGFSVRSISATDCVMLLLQHHLAALGVATSQQLQAGKAGDPRQSPLKSPRAVLMRTRRHPTLSSRRWGREKSGNQIGGGRIGLLDDETVAWARCELDLSSRLFRVVAGGFHGEDDDYAERVLLTKMGFLAETVGVRGELLHLFARACEVAREDEAFLAEMAVVGGGVDETGCDSPFFTKRKSSELQAKQQGQLNKNICRENGTAEQPMEKVASEGQSSADNAVTRETSETANGTEDAAQEPLKKKRKKSKTGKAEKKKRKKGKRSKKRKKHKTADTTDRNGINTEVPNSTDGAMHSQHPPVAKVSPPPPPPPAPQPQPQPLPQHQLQPTIPEQPPPRPQPQPPHVAVPPGLEFTPVVQKVHPSNTHATSQANETPKNATNQGTSAGTSNHMEGSQEVTKRPVKQMMHNFFALHGSSTTDASPEMEPESHTPANTVARPSDSVQQPVPVSDQRNDVVPQPPQLDPSMSQSTDPSAESFRPSIPRLCPPKEPLRVLCSEALLEEYGEAVSQLASGSWTRSFFSESPPPDGEGTTAASSSSLGGPSPSTMDIGGGVSETTNLGRRIVLCDSPLLDRVGVDVELPRRCGIVLARLSSWAAATSVPPVNGQLAPPPTATGVRSGGKEFVRRAVGLAATGRYAELHILLCTDAAITPEIAGDVTILQNALLGQAGCPCGFVNVQFVAPATTLSAAVAVKALQPCSGIFAERAQGGLHGEISDRGIPDWVEAFSSVPMVQQRASFLLSLAPTLGVVACLEFLRHCAQSDNFSSSTSPSFGQVLRNAATDPGGLLRALRDNGAAEITLRSVQQISNGVRARLCRQGPT